MSDNRRPKHGGKLAYQAELATLCAQRAGELTQAQQKGTSVERRLAKSLYIVAIAMFIEAALPGYCEQLNSLRDGEVAA